MLSPGSKAILAVLLVLSCAALAACGGSTDDTPPPPDTSCKAYAETACARAQSCNPLSVESTYADVEGCITSTEQLCTKAKALPDSGLTTATVTACNAAYASASCRDVRENSVAGCGSVVGKRANGAGCSTALQCQSGICAPSPAGGCGVCEAPKKAGASCAPPAGVAVLATCEPGHVCEVGMAGATCVPIIPEGAACQASRTCAPGTWCIEGTCQLPRGPNDACAPGDICDPYQGLVCAPSSSTCQKLALAAAGQPCGPMGATIVQCVGLAECVGATAEKTGSCAAVVKLGAACSLSATGVDPCVGPASCVDGTCQITLPACP